jgi:hypothetical protein
MPITAGMIKRANATVHNMNTTQHKAIRAATELGLSALLRSSEYVRKPNKDHHFRGKDITFVLTPARGSSEPRTILSTHAHSYALDEVTGVILSIRSGKTDQEKYGHRMPFDRVRIEDRPDQAFDLVKDLWEWAVHAKPPADAPFFSTADGWELFYSMLNEACKDIARASGFNPSQFSSHSLRIGGASALAAAGVADSIIQIMGRWKSLAFLMYIRLATAAYTKALSTLQSSNVLTADDIKKLHS